MKTGESAHNSVFIYQLFQNDENSVRQVYINDLMTENADLRSQNEKLMHDLNVKEALWLNKEENYIQKVIY